MKITPGKLAKDYRRAYHLRDFVKAEINLGENLVYNIKIQEGNKEPEEEELAEVIYSLYGEEMFTVDYDTKEITLLGGLSL